MDFQDKNTHWISMLEASKLCAYSQEYLSLLARRGKIFSKKIGRNWYTTKEAVDNYLKTQSVFISLPKNIFGRLTGQALRPSSGQATLTAALTPEEPEKGEPVKHAEHSKFFEEFERLNPQISFDTKKEIKPQTPVVIQPVPPDSRFDLEGKRSDLLSEKEDPVLQKLDKLSGSLELFADRVTRKLEEPGQEVLTSEQKEFFDVELSSFSHRFKIFDRYARSMMRNPVRMTTIMITAVVAIFIIGGGFSFGQADYVVQQVKKVFKDADTVQGHFPGVHANEILVLDKSGNVSIFGHIETQGQLRSFAPDGVAPIVVDSMTLVDNLNANYLDGLASKDFTLAFVTKNGNLTYEDVFLEGNVEVGKMLTVKGATKLMDSLQVYGGLGVFGDAVFGKDVIVTSGNLTLKKGTITINNTSLIKNLNAEYLDGIKKQNINLDFVTSNGASTGNGISVGGLEVNGQSDFRGMGFFYKGIWGSDGAFGTLGVAGDVSIGDQDNPGDSNFEVYSKKFRVDANGNVSISGTLGAGNTTVSDLTVSGKVKSNLIASGSFDLGSSTNRWANIFATGANLTSLVVSGSVNFSGITSKSFVINTDNTSSDSEDSYLSFERGTTTPNSTLKWNSTAKRFEFNEPLFIASSSLETIFSVSGGPASISNTLYVQNSGNVGIGTTSPASLLTVQGRGEFQGTASASYLLTGNTLQVGGFASAAYSRFGTSTTGHSNYISTSSDLLISGDLETRGTASFGGVASISGNFFTYGTNTFSGTGSSSFAGSLLVSKGINAQAIVGTGLTINGSTTLNGSLTTSGNVTLGDASGDTLTSNADAWTFANDTNLTLSGGVNGFSFDTNTLSIDATNNRIGILTTTPSTTFEIQGTASASYFLTGNTLQVGGFASAAYSRFGTNTTSHSNYITTINDLLISGDLEVNSSVAFDGHVAIGDNTDGTDLVYVNAQVKSNIIPFSNTFDIGSTANRWQKIWTDSLDVTNLTAASSSISGTVANAFTINSDNASADTEDASVTFERGSPATNAVFEWDGTNNRFDFNFPVFMQTVVVPEPTANFTKLTLKGAADQSSNDYFEIQNKDGSRLFIVETGGAIVASGAAQFGGGSVASAAYSRFGTSTTGHSNYISASNDLLISGDLETRGTASFGGNASISGTFTSVNTGSNSFSGSLLVSKGINAQAIVGTGLTINGSTTLNGSLTTSGNVTLGDASGDTLTSNADAWTFANDTNLTLSGGVNGFSFDTNTLSIDATNNRIGILTTTPSTTFEIQGTASASYLLTGNTLQVGGYASAAYSRFGTNTTTSSFLSGSNDLLITGRFEVDGGVRFDSFASISSNLEVGGYASISGATTLRGVTYTWPSADGSANTFLKTNGTGTLSWATAGVSSNSLDFDEFVDSMTLDANLTINRGGYYVGLGAAPSTVFEVQGTASASYLLTGNTLQVGGYASVAYNRFGTATTGHSNYISTTNDLLISGDLEVKGSISANIASVSQMFISNSAASASLSFRGNGSGGANQSIFSIGVGNGTERLDIFNNSNSPFVTIASTGNVGIGTTAPSGILHVRPTVSFTATGGTITTSGDYTIHTFNSSGTFTPNGAGTVEYLVVGGGGGGGRGGGGGGGAGGFRTAADFAVTAQAYTVTVGAGGAGSTVSANNGANGSDSVFSSITSTGGGGGNSEGTGTAAGTGGSGGGGGFGNGAAGSGTGGQGSNGGSSSGNNGAGGGGAGAVGANSGTGDSAGGAGGAGTASSISGASVTYAGGGGGGDDVDPGGAGGAGGGGAGAGGGAGTTGTAGTANTGGGGGGGSRGSGNGGAGGSGIVIVRYLTSSTINVDSVAVGSTGNVGIGTTAPNSTLTVLNNSTVTALSDLIAGAVTFFKPGASLNNAGLAVAKTSGESLLMQVINSVTNGADNLVINPYGGNVGIGVTPEFAFDVEQSVADSLVMFENTNAAPLGLLLQYKNATPNGTGNEFIRAYDNNGGNLRFSVRSNGGIANYSANDVNLSDERTKNLFGDAPSEIEKFSQLKFVLAEYKENPLAVKDVMLTAQQVQTVYPELVTIFDQAKGTLGVREGALAMHAYKAIQDLNNKTSEVYSANGVSKGELVKFTPDGTVEKALDSVIGVVSSITASTSARIEFSGRVPVKVVSENSMVKVGDRITLSKTMPGYGMKQKAAGQSVGIALENQMSDQDKILVFVNLSYWAPTESQVLVNGELIIEGAGSKSYPDVLIVSSVDFGDFASGSKQVLATTINTILTKVENLWAKGDIIAEGIKKTYYAVSEFSIFNFQFSIADWGTREITIAPTADSSIVSMFQGSAAQAANQSRLNLEENGAYLATYGVDSTRGEIFLSGSSDLIGGEAKIFFDFSFSSVISPDIPLKVLITPTTFIQGQLYVSDKTVYGFVVKGLNGAADGPSTHSIPQGSEPVEPTGSGQAKFDWLVIARRKGFEGGDAASQNDNIQIFKDLNITDTGSASASPELTPTPEPTLEPTLEPTPEVEPPSEVQPPTESPTPSLTPIPTPEESPTPSLTPEITPEATPENTPEPTPDATPEPSLTPTPDVSPTPTPEPTLSPTPELTPTPEPSL